MKNRKLIVIGALIIGALTFAGCSNDSSDSNNTAKAPAVTPVATPVQAPTPNTDTNQNKENSVTKTETKTTQTNDSTAQTKAETKKVVSNNSNKAEVKVDTAKKTEVQNTNKENTTQKVDTAKKNTETKPSTTENKNTNNFGGINPNIVKHIEMDGTNTAEVGQYATTTYNAATTTDADIIKFYNDKIKGSNNAYFTLIDGNESIQFVNSDAQMITKGPISIAKRDIIGNPTYYGEISGDKIIWRKASN